MRGRVVWGERARSQACHILTPIARVAPNCYHTRQASAGCVVPAIQLSAPDASGCRCDSRLLVLAFVAFKRERCNKPPFERPQKTGAAAAPGIWRQGGERGREDRVSRTEPDASVIVSRVCARASSVVFWVLSACWCVHMLRACCGVSLAASCTWKLRLHGKAPTPER